MLSATPEGRPRELCSSGGEAWHTLHGMRPRRREAQRAGAAAPEPRSTRYRNLVNPFEPVRIFSDDQVASMHRAALDILEHQGMRVVSARGLSVLRSAGARVDDSSQMVRLDPGMVSKAISTIPAEVALIARNPARSCRVGGRHVVFAPVAGPPSVSDLERGKRTATLEDYRDLVRLSQAFDVIHVLGQMVEPQDTSVSERHLETSLAQLTLGDKVPHFYCRGDAQLADCFAMLRIAQGIDEATFRGAAHCYSICNTNSPLQLDVPMTDGIIEFAANGQLMIVTPFTLAGAMAPITIAGALTLAHAEALFGITLSQSEEHTSELQSQSNLVCRLLLEKKNNKANPPDAHRRRPSARVAPACLAPPHSW